MTLPDYSIHNSQSSGEFCHSSICVRALLLLVLCLTHSTSARAESEPLVSEYVAAWSLNHGAYLVDVGRYLEALEAFDTAFETSGTSETRSDALLQKGSVLSVFLDATQDAVKAYDTIGELYPDTTVAGVALFRAGMALFDATLFSRAIPYFERYLELYPDGVSRISAEFLLKQSRLKAQQPKALIPEHHVPSRVRIRVLKGHRNITLESAQPLNLSPLTSDGLSARLRAESGLVYISGSITGVQQLHISSRSPIRVRAGNTSRVYRGDFVVSAQDDVLEIINHVDAEAYLYGVVTKESVATWPAEALKAQAIASRSYGLYNAQRRSNRRYDMVDDEGSQVYWGIDGESDAGRRAVDETRGLVVAYDGRPIYAMFTSNAGWHTDESRCIFNQPLPYLTAVPDPHSPNEIMGRWTKTYSASDVRQRLSSVANKRFGRIFQIRLIDSCPSGRPLRVEVVAETGTQVMRTRPTIGRALQLPDILVTVQKDGDNFVFSGGGFGHGVGLSQWGAKSMSDKGFSAAEILMFYYRNTELVRLYP